MSGLVFVDTNVLLYAVDESDQQKQEHARGWREWLWETRRGRLSFQVLQEVYSNVCRKWPKAKEAARLEIGDLLKWNPISMIRSPFAVSVAITGPIWLLFLGLTDCRGCQS